MPRRRKLLPKRHIRKVNTRFQCSIPLPPIVYESPILKGVDGVDQMTAFYGYFANSKVEEYLPYLNQCIFRLNSRLDDNKHTEVHLDLILKHLEARILSLELNDNNIIKLSQKEKQNLSYKLTPISDIDNEDLGNAEHECVFNKILPVFTECFRICNNVELFLFLVGFISQGLLQMTGNQVTCDGNEFNFLQLNQNLSKIEKKDDDIVKSAESLLKTILTYFDSVYSVIGNDKYNNLLASDFCDRRIGIQFMIDRGLNKYNKKVKAGLRNDLSKLWLQYVNEDETLYNIAEQCKTDEKKNQVSITASEMTTLEQSKIEVINKISELRNSVEQNLEENKKRIIGNTEFELYEREKTINKAANSSYIHNEQVVFLKRLLAEKAYWISLYKKKLERTQKYYGEFKLSIRNFREIMTEYISKVPENLQKNLKLLIDIQNKEINARNLLAEKKTIRSHLTNKIRQQWIEHNEFMIQSLTDDGKVEDQQCVKKTEIQERIKRDCSEARYSYHRSFIIPSYFPKRLEPPFPSSSMEQQRSQRLSTGNQSSAISPMTQKHGNTPNSSQSSYKFDNDTPFRGNDRKSLESHHMDSGRSRSPKRSGKERKSDHSSSTTPKYDKTKYEENGRDKRRRDEFYEMKKDENNKGKKRKVEERPSSRSLDRREEYKQKNLQIIIKKKRFDDDEIDMKDSDVSNDSLSGYDKRMNGTSENSNQTDEIQNTPDSSTYYSFVNMKELKLSTNKILEYGKENFMKFLLPYELNFPLNFFASNAPEVDMNLPFNELTEKEIKTYKNELFIYYMLKFVHHECAFQISVRASEDFLEQRIFPFEIARQIIHNQGTINKMKTQYEQHSKHVPSAYKVKVTVACGLLKALTKCTESINKLYELENSELISMRAQTRLNNSHDFTTEHLKQLRSWMENLVQVDTTIGLMKNHHQRYLTFFGKLKDLSTIRLTAIKKKRRALEAARQRLMQNVEAKEKRLEEIRQRYTKLGDSYKQSCIKYSEADNDYTKKKLAYNVINEDLKRAGSASFGPDPVTEALYKKYKEMVLCPTCKVRQKDSALTKCYHLFCEECIVNLFKSRNRKCPECNTRVGVNEYKRVFI